MKELALIFSLMLLVPSSAFAASLSPLQGVWKGTIGKFSIQACFLDGSDFQFGAYYYFSQLKTIHLDRPSKGAVWWETEENKGPRWQLNSVAGDHVHGSWSDKGKTLPIALNRVPLNKEELIQPCGAEAYVSPLFTAPKITEMAAMLDGVAYTSIAVDVGKQFDVSIAGFKLNGSDANTMKINKLLTAIIPIVAKGADYADCITSALSANGRDGNYSVNSTPVLISANWLVARTGSEDYCGGAHPNAGSIDTVYDLKNGVKVDVEKWFLPEAMDLKDGINPQGELRDFVLKAEMKQATAECSDVYDSASYWNLALSKAGVNFTPSLPHVATACAESVDVPFALAAKFMNAEGKAQLNSFQAELSE